VGAQRKVSTLRVVLDTNVVVSALLFAKGRLRWLRQAWQQAEVVPVVNQQTTLELLRVLTYPKFHLFPGEQEDLLAEYLPYCEVASVEKDALSPNVRDAADQIFLQLAIGAQVAYLVTGDADLLHLGKADPPISISIVTPEQFRLRLAGRE
jgi:putative PIN family toxin of toxin-antitoxin system